MELEDKILKIVNEICGAEDGELTMELDLFEAGLLDSFGVIELITALEESFGVRLRIEEIPRARIATPLKIAALVQEAGAAV